MNSLRGKILLGYLALALAGAAFALFAFATLRFLEARIVEDVAIDALREGASEMRRHEKNFFLYRDVEELRRARALATALLQRLGGEPAAIGAIGAEDLRRLAADLARYRDLLERHGDPQHALEEVVRAAGHEISMRSERIAEQERAALVSNVQQAQNALFASIGVLALLGITGGQVLARVVVRPLRLLEDKLRPLAQGRFREFPAVSGDREIVSFTEALNRMLKELEARRRQVLQSEKLASLGTLSSGVAHELNNPLGNISASCQVLLEEAERPDPTFLREWLGNIEVETERARRIVRTLLDYASRRAFERRPTPLAEVIERSLLLVRRELPAADTVRVDLAAGLAVCADGQRLQQVFINLLQNALAAGARQVRIAARASCDADWPPPGAYVVGSPDPGAAAAVIAIEDDGPGIPAEQLAQVFDPFYTTRGPGRGTGLGLYIVDQIVREHDGCMAVENRAGGGTRFTFWLPCRDET